MSIEGKIIEFCKNFTSKFCKMSPLKCRRKIILIPFHGFLSTKPPAIYNFLESNSHKMVYESPRALINDVKPSIKYQKQKQSIQKWKLIILKIKTENSRVFNRFGSNLERGLNFQLPIQKIESPGIELDHIKCFGLHFNTTNCLELSLKSKKQGHPSEDFLQLDKYITNSAAFFTQ